MRRSALLTLLLLAGFLAPNVPAGDDPEWVHGSWVGFTETFASFFRLGLESGGTGLLANASRARGEVYRYRVRWSLQGEKIKLDLDPIDPDSPPIRAKGKATPKELDLELSRRGSGSARRLRLYPETVFEEQLELLQERMAETVEE